MLQDDQESGTSLGISCFGPSGQLSLSNKGHSEYNHESVIHCFVQPVVRFPEEQFVNVEMKAKLYRACLQYFNN